MQRSCDACGSAYEAKRSSSRFCSPLCRQRARRNPALVESGPSPAVDEGDGGAVTLATSARVDALDVAGLPQAQMALALARRLDSPRETGSAVAAMTKQLAVLLDDLDRRGKREADALDELRERRKVKSLA